MTFSTTEINMTLLLSVIAICLSAMATCIKIFAKKPNPEELPGKSHFCTEHRKEFIRLEKEAIEEKNKITNIKETITNLEKDMIILQKDGESSTKTLEEIKINNKEIAQRMDNLLKQILEFIE